MGIMVYVMDYYAYSEIYITDLTENTTGPMLPSASTRKQDNTVDACDTIATLTAVLFPAPKTALSEIINMSRYEQKAAVPEIITPKSSHD